MKKPHLQIKERIQKNSLFRSFQALSQKKVSEWNTYANDNKKQTITAFFSLSVILFLLTIFFSLSSWHTSEDSSKEESISSFSSIEDIGQLITQKQQIDEIKQKHVEDERSIILQGRQLKKELDSLIALPNKTHKDSLDILRKHKQLEFIVKHLNEKD